MAMPLRSRNARKSFRATTDITTEDSKKRTSTSNDGPAAKRPHDLSPAEPSQDENGASSTPATPKSVLADQGDVKEQEGEKQRHGRQQQGGGK
jgi:hypothetical protein